MLTNCLETLVSKEVQDIQEIKEVHIKTNKEVIINNQDLKINNNNLKDNNLNQPSFLNKINNSIQINMDHNIRQIIHRLINNKYHKVNLNINNNTNNNIQLINNNILTILSNKINPHKHQINRPIFLKIRPNNNLNSNLNNKFNQFRFNQIRIRNNIMNKKCQNNIKSLLIMKENIISNLQRKIRFNLSIILKILIIKNVRRLFLDIWTKIKVQFFMKIWLCYILNKIR